MKKILYISPHLSTGGCPQFLLKRIKCLLNSYDIYVVEYSLLSPDFTVQRNKIKNILKPKNFFSLGNEKQELLELIEEIKPDIVHLEEIPELFMDKSIADKIYSKDRKYLIFEILGKYLK